MANRVTTPVILYSHTANTACCNNSYPREPAQLLYIGLIEHNPKQVFIDALCRVESMFNYADVGATPFDHEVGNEGVVGDR